MNIVIFSPSWPKNADANGIVTYCDNMVSALRKNGHHVVVLAANRGAVVSATDSDCVCIDGYKSALLDKLISKLGDFFSPGFEQYYLGAKAILWGIREIEKTGKIDVLEMEESFGWHYFLQKRVSFPVAMRLHGPHYINGSMGNAALTPRDCQRLQREARAFRAARYVNAPCRWVLDEPQKKYDVKWPVQDVFFNPIESFSAEKCWGSSSYKAKQLLFVGRFDNHKGGDIVIEVFSKILEIEPSATLVFVGPDQGVDLPSGEKLFIQEAIEQYIPENKRHHIRYLGLVGADVINGLRRQSHITLMASRNEIFGYTVLESLAVAAPIVAPYVGGIKELFEDNVSGVFFEGSNVTDMTKKVVDLLADSSKAESISRAAYKRSQEAFSFGVIANKATQFYSDTISYHAKK
jgi:glycosyltransferase involved in cell wall biosynthesis